MLKIQDTIILSYYRTLNQPFMQQIHVKALNMNSWATLSINYIGLRVLSHNLLGLTGRLVIGKKEEAGYCSQQLRAKEGRSRVQQIKKRKRTQSSRRQQPLLSAGQSKRRKERADRLKARAAGRIVLVYSGME